MANFIPEQTLEEIQLRNDIVEVIGHYIPLKRAGANFKALCPFHNERTPSFIVSPSKQIFHCFGCGAGGNVFGFVMQYEHLSFVDTVKLLAQKAGIVIPEETRGGDRHDEGSSKGLWDVNKFAAQQFHKWLYDPKMGKFAYSYLRKRGIKDEIIKKFQLGYAPGGGGKLIEEAKKKGISLELLKLAGLITGVSRGSHGFCDMFRNRLILPIFGVTGKVAGFSGRVLDNSLPKYINTPETQIFHKGKILYGLHASKSEIAKHNQVIICEGHFDFIRLYGEGIRNAVASCGTAFTQDQVHSLRRYTEEIVVSFDSDTAGKRAALRGLEMFLEEGLRVRIVNIPKPFDPDSFVKTKGIDSFKKLIAKAEDILNVKFKDLCKEHSIETVDGKLKIINNLLPDITKIRSEIWKRQFIKIIASKLDVPEDSLWIELRKLRKSSRSRQPSSAIEKIAYKDKKFAGERFLVQLLLDDELLPKPVKEMLNLQELQSPEYKMILEGIIKLKDSNKWKGLNSLMAYIKDETLLKMISRLVADEVSFPDRKKAIMDCLYNIRRKYREKKIKGFINEIERAEKARSGDVQGLVHQINKLQKELLQLEQNFKTPVCNAHSAHAEA